jgi:hypothetical protein
LKVEVNFLATTATKFITTTEDRLNLLPISNGQLIFVRDSRKICLDYQDNRVEYGQIIVLTDDKHRLSIEQPFNTFYFVLQESILWRYENFQWIQITTPPKENLVFVGEDPLPIKGKEGVLYATSTDLYTWNGMKYTKMGTLEWEEF